MPSNYALVSTLPGMQHRVLEEIAQWPEVRAGQVLFGEQIALRFDTPQDGAPAVPHKLARHPGVVEAKVYQGNAAYLRRNQTLN